MSGIEAVLAIIVLIAFISGVAIGVVVIVSIASRREDRMFSLTGKAPDAVCRGARRVTGLWTLGGRPVQQTPALRDEQRRQDSPR